MFKCYGKLLIEREVENQRGRQSEVLKMLDECNSEFTWRWDASIMKKREARK